MVRWLYRVSVSVSATASESVAPPSQLLKKRRLQLAGHVLRAAERTPQPLVDVLLLKLQAPRRRGSGAVRTYRDILLSDLAGCRPTDADSDLTGFHDLAIRRVI
jgi:hypothetical protein